MADVTLFESMDEQEFLAMFERREFPLDQWRHRPHVTVAYLYLRQYPLEQAIGKMRQGIQAHNAAHGLAGAYHETITQFWGRVIYAVMSAHGPSDSASHFFDRHSYLLNKMLPLLFYSYGRLISKQARHEFVEPDLLALPLPVEVSVAQTNYEPDPGKPPLPPDPVAVLAQTSQTIEHNPR
jgi:hypothetical protein